MKSHVPEYDLLFGAVAVRLEILSREDIIRALRECAKEPWQSLSQVLVNSAVIDDTVQTSIDVLVRRLYPYLSTKLLKDCDGWRNDEEKSEHGGTSTTIVEHAVNQPKPSFFDFPSETTPTHEASADPDSTTPYDHRSDDIPDADGVVEAKQRYRIIRLVAQGGLGAVHLARDEALGREVALKMIRTEFSSYADGRSRFLLEARITGNLEHPGIVGVHALGDLPAGGPFYAMRFIKGDTLQSVIARFHSNDQPNREHQERRLALRKLLGRFIDVCNAIAYAHSRGVLHRDIKPSNVMVGKFGETLVVDWGLAKILYRADTSSPLEKSASFDPADAMEMTASGMVVGTPAYMSPEQAAGRQDLMEPASDVFSLGATLYTILTGRSPYSGKGVTDVLDCARRCDFPRPSEVSSSIHAALEAICLKAMARDPEDRYASPRALADDIERWLADAPVSAYREPLASSLARWTRRYRAAILGSAIVLLMLTMAIVVILIGFSPSQRPTTDTGRVTRPLSPEQIRQIADVIRQSDSGPRSGAGSPTTTPTPR